MESIYDKKYRKSRYQFICVACNKYIFPGDIVIQLNEKNKRKLQNSSKYYGAHWIHHNCDHDSICMKDIHPDFMISSNHTITIYSNYIKSIIHNNNI